MNASTAQTSSSIVTVAAPVVGTTLTVTVATFYDDGDTERTYTARNAAEAARIITRHGGEAPDLCTDAFERLVREHLERAAPAPVRMADAPAGPLVMAPSREAVAAALLKARAACADDARWMRAANKASLELERGAWAWNGRMLVVRSRSSARQYRCTATTCECPAAARSIPCWHRAAARLVERAATLPAQAAA